jgi:hypothetical protein
VYLAAAPNSFERSVVASDGDSAASASTGVAPVAGTVVVAVVVALPNRHTANRCIDINLCGCGNDRRRDCDSANRQQAKQYSAHGITFLVLLNVYV